MVYETVKFVEPKDLLNLARTSKDFRALLTSRSAAPIWKMVLSQVVPKLPPCPQDLCEMEYASLLFDTFCMACLSTRVSIIKTDFKMRLRLCPTCKKNNIKQFVHEYYWKGDSYSILWDTCILLPPSFEDKLPENVNDNDLGTPYDSATNKTESLYFIPEVVIMLSKLKSLESDPSAYQKFGNEQKAVATRMMNEGRELALWKSNAEIMQINQNLKVRDCRAERIEEEMSALGWEKKFYPTYSLDKGQRKTDYEYWQHYLYQHKPFSQRSWKITLPRLHQIYERSKRILQFQELTERVAAHYLAFRTTQPLEKRAFMPSWAEVSTSSIALEFTRKHYVECTDDMIQALIPHLVEAAIAYFRPRALEDLRMILCLPNRSDLPLAETSEVFSVPESMLNIRSLFTCTCSSCGVFGLSSHIVRKQVFIFSELLDHITTKGPRDLWNSVKPKGDPLLQQVIDEILEIFEISADSSLLEVEQTRTFRCRCDQPGDQAPLSFKKLVQHVYRHRIWFRMMADYRRHSADTPLFNSHSIERLRILLDIFTPSEDLNRADGTTSAEACHNSPPSRVYCRPCFRISRYPLGTSKNEEAMEYHMQYRHGKKLESGDFSDVYPLL
ncbi:hypothetical protein CPC08DRAFT_661821 [Agrocybe pediades]|nr:hypothetical protein CPC08DRAFT_661821 [Agrocybe pediades]